MANLKLLKNLRRISYVKLFYLKEKAKEFSLGWSHTKVIYFIKLNQLLFLKITW